MDVPKMPVKCGVNSCHYWQNNYCMAQGLEVNPMKNSAQTSHDTCCTTFKPKNK